MNFMVTEMEYVDERIQEIIPDEWSGIIYTTTFYCDAL